MVIAFGQVLDLLVCATQDTRFNRKLLRSISIFRRDFCTQPQPRPAKPTRCLPYNQPVSHLVRPVQAVQFISNVVPPRGVFLLAPRVGYMLFKSPIDIKL
jgi:hypothetical protein